MNNLRLGNQERAPGPPEGAEIENAHTRKQNDAEADKDADGSTPRTWRRLGPQAASSP